MTCVACSGCAKADAAGCALGAGAFEPYCAGATDAAADSDMGLITFAGTSSAFGCAAAAEGSTGIVTCWSGCTEACASGAAAGSATLTAGTGADAWAAVSDPADADAGTSSAACDANSAFGADPARAGSALAASDADTAAAGADSGGSVRAGIGCACACVCTCACISMVLAAVKDSGASRLDKNDGSAMRVVSSPKPFLRGGVSTTGSSISASRAACI